MDLKAWGVINGGPLERVHERTGIKPALVPRPSEGEDAREVTVTFPVSDSFFLIRDIIRSELSKAHFLEPQSNSGVSLREMPNREPEPGEQGEVHFIDANTLR